VSGKNHLALCSRCWILKKDPMLKLDTDHLRFLLHFCKANFTKHLPKHPSQVATSSIFIWKHQHPNPVWIEYRIFRYTRVVSSSVPFPTGYENRFRFRSRPEPRRPFEVVVVAATVGSSHPTAVEFHLEPMEWMELMEL